MSQNITDVAFRSIVRLCRLFLCSFVADSASQARLTNLQSLSVHKKLTQHICAHNCLTTSPLVSLSYRIVASWTTKRSLRSRRRSRRCNASTSLATRHRYRRHRRRRRLTCVGVCRAQLVTTVGLRAIATCPAATKPTGDAGGLRALNLRFSNTSSEMLQALCRPPLDGDDGGGGGGSGTGRGTMRARRAGSDIVAPPASPLTSSRESLAHTLVELSLRGCSDISAKFLARYLVRLRGLFLSALLIARRHIASQS